MMGAGKNGTRERGKLRAIETQRRNEVEVHVRLLLIDSHRSVPILFVRDAGDAGRKITLKYTYTVPFSDVVHIQLR